MTFTIEGTLALKETQQKNEKCEKGKNYGIHIHAKKRKPLSCISFNLYIYLYICTEANKTEYKSKHRNKQYAVTNEEKQTIFIIIIIHLFIAFFYHHVNSRPANTSITASISILLLPCNI